MTVLHLQRDLAPKSICFGCGPANSRGLRIDSQVPKDAGVDAEVTAEWRPEAHHEAFPGVLNGGIIGALLDCHSNWTASWFLMTRDRQETPPCTVTAEYSIQLKRPTPTGAPVQLRARVVESAAERVTVEATLTAGGKVCASCRGVFVAVKEGHPAYHRW